jgi:hypothetical protein
MRPETLKRCANEASKLIELIQDVPTHYIEGPNRMSTEYVNPGKASGLVRAQSIILTRALADLRKGR